MKVKEKENNHEDYQFKTLDEVSGHRETEDEGVWNEARKRVAIS